MYPMFLLMNFEHLYLDIYSLKCMDLILIQMYGLYDEIQRKAKCSFQLESNERKQTDTVRNSE